MIEGVRGILIGLVTLVKSLAVTKLGTALSAGKRKESRMKWPPPKPNFELIKRMEVIGFGQKKEFIEFRGISEEGFNIWYEQHITSLGSGELVYGEYPYDDGVFTWFSWQVPSAKNKAIIIGIEPITEPTADEILAELASCDWTNKSSMVLVDKARAYLERKRK